MSIFLSYWTEKVPQRRNYVPCAQRRKPTFDVKIALGNVFFCRLCCLEHHRRMPFHRIRGFSDDHFEKITLHDLGFVLHLGHNGAKCPTASDDEPDAMEVDGDQIMEDDDVMVIVDTNGIFHHHVWWCACPERPRPDISLFRMGLFPATLTKPKTVFTFNVLEAFHMDQMECRISASNFYNRLRRRTNETFPNKVPVSPLGYPLL
jgi:CxC2 like cysteine cluster associated with KDZ transposases